MTSQSFPFQKICSVNHIFKYPAFTAIPHQDTVHIGDLFQSRQKKCQAILSVHYIERINSTGCTRVHLDGRQMRCKNGRDDTM